MERIIRVGLALVIAAMLGEYVVTPLIDKAMDRLIARRRRRGKGNEHG